MCLFALRFVLVLSVHAYPERNGQAEMPYRDACHMLAATNNS